MAVAPTARGDRPAIAAGAFLRALTEHGVVYFFCNRGTEPRLIGATSRAKKAITPC
jgi:hypothetical protein